MVPGPPKPRSVAQTVPGSQSRRVTEKSSIMASTMEPSPSSAAMKRICTFAVGVRWSPTVV